MIIGTEEILWEMVKVGLFQISSSIIINFNQKLTHKQTEEGQLSFMPNVIF